MNSKTLNENTLYIFSVMQTKNQKYAFMSWDIAVKHFNIADYKEVTMGYFEGNGKTENEALNEIYEGGYVGVSDIIRFDGKYYYVDQIGYRDITEHIKEMVGA